MDGAYRRAMPRSIPKLFADHLLGEPVEQWIMRRRPDMSYRHIAAELKAATDGRVDLSTQTIINWEAGVASERQDNRGETGP